MPAPQPSLHHRLRISAGIRADLDWWLSFARTWNSKAFFLDHQWLPSPQFQLFTDASHLGYGCYWQGHWISRSWNRRQVAHDIQWKELFAVLLAAMAWDPQWSCKRLLVHCNNNAVVNIWHTGTTKHPACMHLVCTLFLTAATYNFILLMQHILGVDNSIADALSQFHRFCELAPEADPNPKPTSVIRTSR